MLKSPPQLEPPRADALAASNGPPTPHPNLARKTAIAVRELVVGEVIGADGIGVRGRIDAVSAAGGADVRAVDGGPEGHHVLMDHAAEEGVAA